MIFYFDRMMNNFKIPIETHEPIAFDSVVAEKYYVCFRAYSRHNMQLITILDLESKNKVSLQGECLDIGVYVDMDKCETALANTNEGRLMKIRMIAQ